jgi:hypothetical protein
MKTIDMRFDSALIQSWIGKKFNKYKCDAFEFTNSVTQIVGLYIGDEVYALTNVQEAVDYFGATEDMAVAKLSASEDVRIKSAFKDVEMISTPVGEEITSVKSMNNRLWQLMVNRHMKYGLQEQLSSKWVDVRYLLKKIQFRFLRK